MITTPQNQAAHATRSAKPASSPMEALTAKPDCVLVAQVSMARASCRSEYVVPLHEPRQHADSNASHTVTCRAAESALPLASGASDHHAATEPTQQAIRSAGPRRH